MSNQTTIDLPEIQGALPAFAELPGSEFVRNRRRCRILRLGARKTAVLEIDVTAEEHRQVVYPTRFDYTVVPDLDAEMIERNSLRILGFDWRDEFRSRCGDDQWPHVTFNIPNNQISHSGAKDESKSHDLQKQKHSHRNGGARPRSCC